MPSSNAYEKSSEPARFIAAARVLDAAIIQPACLGSIHSLVHPAPLCQARATDYVEVMAPLFDRCAFVETVLAIHESTISDYGIDRVWCRYFAARRRWDLCDVCAIVEVQRMGAPRHGADGAPSGFVKRWDLRSRDGVIRMGGTYNVTRAVQDDKCVRRKFRAYDTQCLVLGCRGSAEQRTHCDSRRLVATRLPDETGPTCAAPGWPVYYSDREHAPLGAPHQHRWQWMGMQRRDGSGSR